MFMRVLNFSFLVLIFVILSTKFSISEIVKKIEIIGNERIPNETVTMFSGIKIAVVLLVLSAAGGGFIYVKKLQSDCLRRNIPLYIGNNIKTLFKLNSNRLYISAYNKVQTSSLIKINGKIDIIGSAHNISEIREKIQQGCKKILLSRKDHYHK